jgi:hypothetical protein
MGLKTFHTSHGLLIAAAVTRKTPIRAPHHAQKMNSKFMDVRSFAKLRIFFFRLGECKPMGGMNRYFEAY